MVLNSVKRLHGQHLKGKKNHSYLSLGQTGRRSTSHMIALLPGNYFFVGERHSELLSSKFCKNYLLLLISR